MKSVMLIGAVLVTSYVAGYASEANGQGLYISVGQSRHHGGWNDGNYRGFYGNNYRVHHPGHWGGGHFYHDTSHYDYHPGGYVRHYNHFDYVPGHYDYHQTGHWDHGN
ncbi:hypothetical protein [Bythopirellula polymerisocia]|uniref:Uncharacterized protein n=1 Tax=Bythopirellula polymerisocia TaxID=2528003 RepID=A0A5C6D107_9BACT|nr:hypothetical protein [Bythopirellula polymerisocia]TWU29431.1 hypothetical protein Pla144_02090 [Bythopirellula polymerisocia]